MNGNSNDMPVIGAIISGIPDMISIISEMKENKKNIQAVLLQGEDIKKQIREALAQFDIATSDLDKLQTQIKNFRAQDVKGIRVNKFLGMVSCIPSVLEDIEVAKKKLNTLSVLYSDVSRALHSSNQISSDMDRDTSGTGASILAYEMSLDELEGVLGYFQEICSNVSIISYEVQSNTLHWMYASSKAKTWFLSKEKKAQWGEISSLAKEANEHSATLVKHSSTLSSNTQENVEQWRELLNLYHV